ncbi:MAG TPA: outer membrane protein assembly factor BamD [Polyangiaceae bacterium]|nr:outer membrane protein assembly factor BamD [Polyangiaceae bacterium]
MIAAAVGATGLAAAQLGALVLGEQRTDPSPALIPPAPVETSAGSGARPSPMLAPSTGVPESLRESHAAAPPADSSRSAARQFASEVELLEPARTAIARGDYATALVLLTKHRREFPNGQLAQEREALRVRALWGQGQLPAARAAAKAFSKRYPGSALLSWMKAESGAAP